VQIAPHLRRGSALRRHTGHECKRGMWVQHMGRTAILLDLLEEDIARIQYVEMLGGTNAVRLEGGAPVNDIVQVQAHALRQAYLEEIPASRIRDLEPKHLMAMGYLKGPK
jgi:hypothetical protein